MITCCPQCKTRFRATPEQLAIRQGLVKCGHCGNIFNGFAHVYKDVKEESKTKTVEIAIDTAELSALEGKIESSLPSLIWTPATQDSDQQSPEENIEAVKQQSPGAIDNLQGHVNDFPQTVTWADKTQSDKEDDTSEVSTNDPATISDSLPETNESTNTNSSANVETILLSDNTKTPSLIDKEIKQQKFGLPGDDSSLLEYQPTINFAPKRSKKGIFILLFLMIVLLVQTAYLWRTEIVTYLPQTKPTFEVVCHSLGCKLPLLKQVESITIEASDMQDDERRPNVVLVNAVLRNHSDLLLAYPSVEITLTDNFDRAIARRSLDAAEYVPISAKEGFAPDSELVTHMAIEIINLKPSGYRLRPYYR